jgi:hypothetical protein
MGTNFYLDQGEGEDYDLYPHIGKRYCSEYGLSFIFYKSRVYQLSVLESLSDSELIADEYGNKINVRAFVDSIINLPYKEQDFEFF